jgi:hypothetical protein
MPVLKVPITMRLMPRTVTVTLPNVVFM